MVDFSADRTNSPAVQSLDNDFVRDNTTIRGIGHVRHKETDRIGDLATELRNLGAEIHEMPDGFQIVPRALRGGDVHTYDDHRMAMMAALLGLTAKDAIQITEAESIDKSYPKFYKDMQSIGLQIKTIT